MAEAKYSPKHQLVAATLNSKGRQCERNELYERALDIKIENSWVRRTGTWRTRSTTLGS